MKRIIVLVVLVALAAGCAAEKGGPAERLDREALFPDDYVAGISDAPMKRALDERDEEAGVVRWAWEEAEGAPKLISVEIHFPPADCDAPYNLAQAGAGAAALAAPPEAVGCYDGRAAYVRFGDYYARIVMLGIGEEADKASLVASRLVKKLTQEK